MDIASFLRPPPRRRPAWVGRVRLLAVICLAGFAFAVSAGPASAYRCVAAGQMECSKRPAPATPPRKDADVASFLFFIAIIGGILIVPIASKRLWSEPTWLERLQADAAAQPVRTDLDAE
jgi:hypothetical protein